MVHTVSVNASWIKVLVLVGLEELDSLSDIWVDVPPLVLRILVLLVLVVDARQHALLVQTLRPVQVTDVDLDLCARCHILGHDLEVVPVHEAFNRVGVELQVQVILEIEVLCVHLLPSRLFDFGDGQP